MLLELNQILKTDNFLNQFLNEKVICFKGKNYPVLFFQTFFNNLKIHNIDRCFLDLNEVDLNSFKQQTSQSFLGNNLFYWLGNVSECNEKKIFEFIEYINSYHGPHYIGFFLDENYIKNIQIKFLVINCGDIIDVNSINDLLIFWPKVKHKIIINLIQKVLIKYKKLNLDQIFLLINYATLMGNKYIDFVELWLEKILIPEQSLFQLSKYFFSKDSTSFFKYWNSIGQEYQPVFWTTYWSEQLFRAYNFLYFHEIGKFVQAKQVAFRLPFSFIQYDWKKHSLDELFYAHNEIYLIDHSLKNGGSEIQLDYFFAKFFEN